MAILLSLILGHNVLSWGWAVDSPSQLTAIVSPFPGLGLKMGMWPCSDKWESLVPSASKDWLPTRHQSCGDTGEMKILNFTESTFSWIRKKERRMQLLTIPKKKKQNKGNRLKWVEVNQNFIWRNGKASVVKWYEIHGTLSWWQIPTRDFSTTWPQREIPLNQVQGKEPGFLMTSLTEQPNRGGKRKKERREESHKALCPRN